MNVTVLSVATRALVEACERMGMKRDELLRAAGLEEEQVFDPDARIDAGKADALWAAAAHLSEDPDLALHAAEQLPDGAYRVLDFVVANAPTVRESLLRIVRYFPIVDPRGVFALRPHAAGMELSFAGLGGGRLPPEAQQYTFAAIVSRLRRATGLSVALEQVDFSYPEPSESREAERIFGCPLCFEAERPALVFGEQVLDSALPMANADLLTVLDRDAERLIQELPAVDESASDKVRTALRDQLKGGKPTVDSVAKTLGMSARTLRRRLSEENVTFAELLTEVRQSLAEEYLRNAHVSLTEVSWLLGFSEHSAFSRAFKRWTGTSPASYRNQQGRSR